jgi:hypothetical protein
MIGNIGFEREWMAGGQFRRIKLTTKQPGLLVQTRDGYYSR